MVQSAAGKNSLAGSETMLDRGNTNQGKGSPFWRPQVSAFETNHIFDRQ